MMKYELAIAVADEVNHAPGKHRMKQGDIIEVRQHPWNWGKKEIELYLIVIVNLPGKWQDERQRLTMPYYKNGVNDDSVAKLLSKRRFKINLSALGIDLAKLRNKMCIYQPFKTARQVVQRFNGRDGNYLLNEIDVDCGHREIVLNRNIIQDKNGQ